ncbi:9441_t:CDS:1, partial [Dentiscutata heterogama]
KVNFSRINLNNDSWDNILQNNNLEPTPALRTSSNSTRSLLERYEVIENRKEELSSDLKMFEALIKIMNDNIENDRLYETYKTLRQPLIDKTAACNEVLNARRQQRT